MIHIKERMKECRVVEISEDARFIGVERGFLVVKSGGMEIGRIELDSIAAVICTASYATVGTSAISKLAEYRVPLVICDRKTKVPTSAAIPLAAHWRQGDVMEAQAGCSLPKKKSAWRSVVRAKLSQQAQVLKYFGRGAESELLSNLADKVKSGDPENLEGRGASAYWRALMGENIRRDREAGDENILFNYGYAILRACAIRSVCAAGLHPSLGMHHCSAGNAHRLADDIMEPFRCFVDIRAREICDGGDIWLTKDNKKKLCGVLSERYFRKDKITSVSQMLADAATELAKYYLEECESFQVDIVRSRHLKGIGNET